MAASSPALAANLDAVADGIEIHLGFMAAERLRAYPGGSVEAAMHGGVPKGRDYYHVNVSLFDAATHAAIADSRVDAELLQPGAAPESKRLEPMKIHGGSGYGQYFRLAGRMPPTIVVRITRPGSAHVTEARFRPQPD